MCLCYSNIYILQMCRSETINAYNLFWKFRNNWSKLINGEFHQGLNSILQLNIMWSMYEISAVYPEDISGQNENS